MSKKPTSKNTVEEIKQYLDDAKIEYSSSANKSQLLKLVASQSTKQTAVAEAKNAPAAAPKNPALEKNTFKEFMMKILTGSAQGILIGVLPSAVMANILKYTGLATTEIGQNLNSIYGLFQIMIPFLIGIAIGMQFKLKPIDIATVGLATGVASGSIKWAVINSANMTNPVTNEAWAKGAKTFIGAGAGDVINAMVVAAIAVLAVKFVAKFLNGFGSIAVIFTPVFVGGFVGVIGLAIAPYVATVTSEIGKIVKNFTTLAPYPMAILIAMIFSIIIITPISTVGIALAISLAGLGSGAAGVGVVATTVILAINSFKVNKQGVSWAILIGAMKGMMPSFFKKPLMGLSFLATAAISAIPVAMFNVQGTPQSAGFGYIGMVSPLQSMTVDKIDAHWITNLINGGQVLIVWFVVPILAGFLVDFIATKWLKLYTPMDFQQDM